MRNIRPKVGLWDPIIGFQSAQWAALGAGEPVLDAPHRRRHETPRPGSREPGRPRRVVLIQLWRQSPDSTFGVSKKPLASASLICAR